MRGILYRQSVIFGFDVGKGAVRKDDGIVGEVGEAGAVEMDGVSVVSGHEGFVGQVFEGEAFGFGLFDGFGGGEIGFVVYIFDLGLIKLVFVIIFGHFCSARDCYYNLLWRLDGRDR